MKEGGSSGLIIAVYTVKRDEFGVNVPLPSKILSNGERRLLQQLLETLLDLFNVIRGVGDA